FLSRAQAFRFGGIAPFGIVPNGLDLRSIRLGRRKGDHLLFLGRLSPVKGAHEAIALAATLGMPLILAGRVGPQDQRYFATAIAPHLGDDKVRFVGEVSGSAKLDLLAGAKALVAPFLWDEPFGLVLIEAMACGTPVLAYDRGAAREIVAHRRTGFLAADLGGLARQAAGLGSISPEACRRHVADHFSAEAMARGYLELYDRIQRREREAVS
ncbi:MAG: glycosyltransferase, partial [Cyanobacteria bacterium REEB65]|nr:glycosyltransferase [Cyanobacteria bacterium REEB65]